MRVFVCVVVGWFVAIRFSRTVGRDYYENWSNNVHSNRLLWLLLWPREELVVSFFHR